VQQADGSRAQHCRGRRLRTAVGRSTGEDGRQSRAQMEDRARRSTGERGLTQQTRRTAQAGEDPPWRDPPLAADSTSGRRRRSTLAAGDVALAEDRRTKTAPWRRTGGALAAGAGDPPCRRDGDERGDPALAEDRRDGALAGIRPWRRDGGKRGWAGRDGSAATARRRQKKWIRAGFRRKP
jgi:hypothetical protein